MRETFKIAENVMAIVTDAEHDVWAKLRNDYAPFVTDADTADITLRLHNGLTTIPEEAQLLYEDSGDDPDMLKLYAYRDDAKGLFFKIVQPYDTHARAVLHLEPGYANATAYIEQDDGSPRCWQVGAAVTSAVQLAFHFAALQNGALLSHASCVMKDGKAYLFLGKSGTGKSTHSRMWLQAFPDAELLNDDHPIVRIDPSGFVTAYGSPWSGKTPCYKNLQAPIGGIVRIRRANANKLVKLKPLAAYASLMPSIFSTPFDPRLADLRHTALEKIVGSVGCYEMYCLPDTDAARVCQEGLKNMN